MIDDRIDFDGKTAIITGAASGMGELASREMAQRGAAVVLADINGERAETIAQEIRAAGGRALAVQTDVRKFDDIRNAVALAVSEFGSTDVTISFAGGEPARMLNGTHDFAEQPVDLIDWGLQVNGRAPVYMARAVLPQMMKQRGGVIINIGSVTGMEATKTIVYSTAKSALVGLTRAVATYGAPYGIRCCCIAPGPVLTRPNMAKMETALGRAAEPEEIVRLVMFLASDKGAFITGTTYLADCGRMVRR
jgi:NAD(P)-dependent dehydrogenase (short-subunit alcohol dehydrogenase family)